MSPTEMYQFSIQESAPIGTAVGRVKAEDSDVGENTDMTYHLREESGSGGDAFKVTTDSDTQEAIIVVQKVQLLGRVESGGGVWADSGSGGISLPAPPGLGSLHVSLITISWETK